MVPHELCVLTNGSTEIRSIGRTRFLPQEGPTLTEPISKEEWRQYFQAKLKAAEQKARNARNTWEQEHLQGEANQIRTKLALLDFDLDAWRWASEHSSR
jgi:hypothetical protein